MPDYKRRRIELAIVGLKFDLKPCDTKRAGKATNLNTK